MPVQVALLGNCEAASFPTDMENLILWEFFSLRHLSGLSGLTLRKQKSRLAAESEGDGRCCPTFASTRRGSPHGRGASGARRWWLGFESWVRLGYAAATGLHIGAPIRSLSLVQARLLFEAVSTGHPKWRFLSFYQLLENAYLTNIKSVLLQEFDKDAARAVEDAKKKLQSEVNQLVDLMTESRLDAEFEAFNVEFEDLIAAGNQYVIALDRGASTEPLYRRETPRRRFFGST